MITPRPRWQTMARASPPSALPHIFDRQFKADRSRNSQGSGLDSRSRERTRASWGETSPPQARPAPARTSHCDYLWPNRYPTAITPWPAPRRMRQRWSPTGEDGHDAVCSPNRDPRRACPACSSSGAVGVGTVKELVPPPKVVPNSVVRIDPKTLKPLPGGAGGARSRLRRRRRRLRLGHAPYAPRLGTGRRSETAAIELTRVDPATGKMKEVRQRLAPCGLAPGPPGTCGSRTASAGLGSTRTIVRVNAKTLGFRPGRSPAVRVLPRRRLRGRLDMGVGRRCRSRGDAGQPKDRGEEGDSTRPFRRRTCVVQRPARQSLGRQLRRGQPHAAARRNRSQRNRRSCCCQSRLPGRRRRHRVGRRTRRVGRVVPAPHVVGSPERPRTILLYSASGFDRSGPGRRRQVQAMSGPPLH